MSQAILGAVTLGEHVLRWHVSRATWRWKSSTSTVRISLARVVELATG